MKRIKSSNIEAVEYNALKKTLSIKFNNSLDIYTYKNVSKQRYDNLMLAPSKGTYFHAHIRNQYAFTKQAPKG